MTLTTKAQRRAIFKAWQRLEGRMTYRALRRLAQPTIGCDGAVVLPWCGMFLCIEQDGYTHS